MSLRSAFFSSRHFRLGGGATAVGSTTPFPVPPALPAGSLIYSGINHGQHLRSGGRDHFRVEPDAGQTISVNVVPAATLKPTVDVRDPSNNAIASATAGAAGQEVVIQTVPATTAGTYTFFVQGTAFTTGTYTLTITLNAALEVESHGGGSNDSQGTAQDLNSALGDHAGAARLAAPGTQTRPAGLLQLRLGQLPEHHPDARAARQ